MKYCTHCGKELMDDAVVCTCCGCAVNGANRMNGAVAGSDVPNVGLNILAFFIPSVGLILFCSMQANLPNKAKQIGLFALTGFIINILITIIWAIAWSGIL